MHPLTTMSTPARRDGVLGVAVAVVWIGGVAVGSLIGWYPTSQAALWWSGLWLGAALAFRRRAPRATFWLAVVVYPLTLRVGMLSGLQILPVLVVVYGAVVAGVVRTWLAGALGTLAVLALLTRGGPSPRGNGTIRIVTPTVSHDYSTAIVLLMAVWAAATLATVVHRLSETIKELEAAKAELHFLHEVRTHEAVLAERNRIARELHDIVAHHVSAIVMRSRAAVVVAADDPDEPLRAVQWIAASGGEAMTSMRSVVKVLRDDTERSATSPGATLDELSTVVQRVRDAGLAVSLDFPTNLPPLSAAAQLAILRITQEALTNVVVHSQSRVARVDLAGADAGVVVRIRDSGPTKEHHTTGGNGLHVMKERVDACGGTVEAGPDPEGGWVVRATIPAVVTP